jgi:hypothetical protein
MDQLADSKWSDRSLEVEEPPTLIRVTTRASHHQESQRNLSATCVTVSKSEYPADWPTQKSRWRGQSEA